MNALKSTTGLLQTGPASRARLSYSSARYRFFLIVTLLSLFAACKKNKDKDGPQEPAEIAMQVKFSGSTIDYNLVDSGFVVLKREGTAIQMYKRFEKSNNLLKFTIDDLSAGNWTAEMYLFARFNATGGRRYRQDKAFVVPAGGAKSGIALAAPTGVITDAWKPYAFFRHEAQGVSVAVALDATNPHFDIEVKDEKWDLFYIERLASNRLQGGANALVAEQIWSCDNGCYTAEKFINNKTAFLPFTQEVGNKAWNNGLIIVVLNDFGGQAVQFTHAYDK